MENCTLENIGMIKSMDLEFILFKTVELMKVGGLMESSMEWVLSSFQTVFFSL